MKSQLVHEEAGQRRYLLVMDQGDDGFAEIENFAKDRGIRSASITAIGAGRSVTLGWFDPKANKYQFTKHDEQVELASFVGDIAVVDGTPALHAHVVVGRSDNTALAGHLQAFEVFPTMEVTLVENAITMDKVKDSVTGVPLIAIDSSESDASVPTTGIPRGINHIGLSVPDLDAATVFLKAAFNAKVAYDGLTSDDDPRRGPDAEHQLGLPSTAAIVKQRMIQIGTGPSIEMFEIEGLSDTPAAGLADRGWEHISLFVDDIDAALARAVEAGATALSEPHDNSRHEDTPGNASVYVRAPWGSLIELQSLPNGHWYGSGSDAEVWTPPAR